MRFISTGNNQVCLYKEEHVLTTTIIIKYLTQLRFYNPIYK